MRYERRLRRGGSYIYDILEKRVLNNIEACELLNKLNQEKKKIFVVYNKQRWDSV